MAALHSTMENSKGNEVSTINSKVARTMVETWEVRIVTILDADGNYTISIEDRNTDKILQLIQGRYPEKENAS
jgi:hypothetical protein